MSKPRVVVRWGGPKGWRLVRTHAQHFVIESCEFDLLGGDRWTEVGAIGPGGAAGLAASWHTLSGILERMSRRRRRRR